MESNNNTHQDSAFMYHYLRKKAQEAMESQRIILKERFPHGFEQLQRVDPVVKPMDQPESERPPVEEAS